MSPPNNLQTHYVGVGNTLTPIGFALTQDGAARNLTGKTVKVYGITAAGAAWIAERTTGVTVANAAGGLVTVDLQSADVTAAGVFYLFLRVYSGSEYDTHPADGNKMRVVVSNG